MPSLIGWAVASGTHHGRIDHAVGTFHGRIPRFVVHASYGLFMAEIKQRNERLAEAMARAGLDNTDLAVAAEVDPRTIERLVTHRERIPRRSTQYRIAEAVQVPVGMLWPTKNGTHATDELLAVYSSRTAMPSGLVMSLLNGAQRQVDVLALAALWLWDTVLDFAPTLAAKSRAGIAVRICLGDPAGESARLRGSEEGIGDLLASRCELAATYARQALGPKEGSIRIHDTTLYASILRFDDDVLANWHLYGAPAAVSPVLHLRRASNHGVAESVASSFERVWDRAHPLTG